MEGEDKGRKEARGREAERGGARRRRARARGGRAARRAAPRARRTWATSGMSNHEAWLETKSAPVPSAGRLSCPKIAGEQPPRARFAHDHHLPRRSWNLRSSSHPVRLHTCSQAEMPMYHMTPRKTADCSPKRSPNQFSTCAGVKKVEGRAGGGGRRARCGGARCTFPLISTCGPKSGSGSGGSSGAGASGTAADAAASSLSTGGAAASAPPSSTGASEATATAARACSGSAGLLRDVPPGTYAAAAQFARSAARSKVAALDNLIFFSLEVQLRSSGEARACATASP